MKKQPLKEMFEKKKNKIICAEGYLFEMERRGYLKAGAFVPEVVLDFPKVVEQLHSDFARAGSDVMVAFTYYAHRTKLKAIGKEHLLEPMNIKALRIAKKVAKKYDILMAGNICNTWSYNLSNLKESKKKVTEIFDEQVKWAKQEKADFIIAETISYLGEALIALEVIKSYGFEAVINFSTSTKKTLDGYEWEDACKILYDKGADVVGFNCGRGPKTLLPLIKKLRKKVKGRIAAVPVPYLTTPKRYAFQQLKNSNDYSAFPINLEHFLLNREEVEFYTKEFLKLDINFMGLCCGNSPHLMRAMAEAIGRKTLASKYSADLKQHPVLGKGKYISKHDKKELYKDWVKKD
jgi:betaine-homocysteine S-methyltransferase